MARAAAARSLRALPADVAVCAAAVADWRVAAPAGQKLKKSADAPPPSIALAPNPDILATLSRRDERRPRLVVGFAAETEDLVANARAKLLRKGCDWILANDVAPGTGTFGGDSNLVHVVDPGDVESWPRMGKDEVARRLALRVAAALGRR